MKNYLRDILMAAVFLLVVSGSVFAVPYYYWASENDGAWPDTLYLWHFNQDEIYTPTTPAGIAQACNEARSGATYDPGMAYISTASAATFGPGGKFGWGFRNVGGTDPNNKGRIYHSVSFFPIEPDPSLSVELWVKFSDTTGPQYLIDKKYSDTVYGGYEIHKSSDGRLWFAVGDGLKNIRIDSSVLIWETNRWYHIAGTWDAVDDTARLYRDGILIGSVVSAGSVIVNSTYEVYLGQRHASTYGGLNGTLDEVIISKTAYAYAAPQTPHYGWGKQYTGTEEGTLALWHFNTDQISEITGGHRADVIGSNTAWYAYTYDTLLPADSNLSHATFGAEGKFGGGLSNVGGTSQYDRALVAGGTNLFPAGSDPSLSVELWVRFNDFNAAYLIDKKGTDTTYGGYQIIRGGTGLLYFQIGDGTKTIKAISAAGQLTWETGRWYHIAGTWNASDDTARLYRDGVLVASTVSNGSNIVNSTRLLIIANRATSSYIALNGLIDEVRITNVPYLYSTYPTECGESGTVYLPGDISGPAGIRDCRVNIYDLKAMVFNWMDCTDPADTVCD